jgi:hypothetical protein
MKLAKNVNFFTKTKPIEILTQVIYGIKGKIRSLWF